MRTGDAPKTSSNLAGTLGRIIGIALYLLLGLLFAVSGLMVPVAGVVVLGIVWILGWYLVVRLSRSHPTWVPVVPVAGTLFWWAYVSLGEALFNWTA